MKKILVPCDFSKPSYEAFKFAMNIAAKTHAEVTVLFAINIPTYDPSLAGATPLAYEPVFLAAIEEDAKKGFEKMQAALGNPSVKTGLEIMQGNIVIATKMIIEAKKIDLIIMGTTGSSGFHEIFIGSNTEKVVRHSPVPVFAVRTAPEIFSIKTILLPTTLRLDQTEFITKVKELQNFFQATLHVLLINTPSNFRIDADAKAQLEEFAKHYKLHDYVLHFSNFRSEEEGIISFTHDKQMDLVAMATHARKGLAHLFTGSITEDVVNHIQCPIWTFSLGK